MTKQFLVKTEWQLRQLSVLFSGLEEESWCQLKVNGKITTLFYCADCFHFGKKCLIWGNFDTTVGKNCTSRPLGMTPENGTWLIRQKITARYCSHMLVTFAGSGLISKLILYSQDLRFMVQFTGVHRLIQVHTLFTDACCSTQPIHRWAVITGVCSPFTCTQRLHTLFTCTHTFHRYTFIPHVHHVY